MLLSLTEVIKHTLAAKMLELSSSEKQLFVTIKDILAKVSVLIHPDLETTQYNLVTNSYISKDGAVLH